MNILSINKVQGYKFSYKKEFEQILNIFAKTLNYKKPIHVDVLITNNKEIKQISNEYRNINKETDVLSFPFGFDESMIDSMGLIFLGEIVLSYEKIRQQAKEFNHSIKREFCFLFTHGLVHLSGKDHKKNVEEEQAFNSIVYSIMNEIGIER